MMKKLVFLLMLSAMMVYIPLNNAEAGKGEGFSCPEGQVIKLEGPALVGTISLDGSYASFSGKCMGETVALTIPWSTDISSVTEANTEGFPLQCASALPEKCQSAEKSIYMIISNVTRFSKTETAVVADVVMLYAVCR